MASKDMLPSNASKKTRMMSRRRNLNDKCNLLTSTQAIKGVLVIIKACAFWVWRPWALAPSFGLRPEDVMDW